MDAMSAKRLITLASFLLTKENRLTNINLNLKMKLVKTD
jgi:hypothetical protein